MAWTKAEKLQTWFFSDFSSISLISFDYKTRELNIAKKMLLSKYKLKLQSLCARHSSHLENQLIPRRKTTVVAFRCDDVDNNHFHDKFFLTGIMRENKK